MTVALLALVAGYGVHLLYTAVAFGWAGAAPGPAATRPARRSIRLAGREWLVQAGLGDVSIGEFGAVVGLLALTSGGIGFALFGSILPALALGGFAATWPVASYRNRRATRRAAALDAWPRLIEEMRIRTTSLGRSIPQALFEVGRRAPAELRPAFTAAQREWLISTDFERTIAVLKSQLADPTADAACETLLVAHELGGADLDRRLAALAADRLQDVEGRKDARAKQAGVRFARRFVLVVPLGMAFVGLSIGNGRDSYRTTTGQLAVIAGIAMVLACWLWSARMLRLPDDERVFA